MLGSVLVTEDLPYIFEENLGQWPDHVFYSLQLGNQNIFIEEEGLKWQVFEHQNSDSDHQCVHGHGCGEEEHPIFQHVFQIDFGTAIKREQCLSIGKSKFYRNYIRGNNPEKWYSKVYSYQSVTIENVYDKIDLRLYSTERGLKYDWIVRERGNVQDIEITYPYLDELNQVDGDLHLLHSLGRIVETAPYAFQQINGETIPVQCEFRLSGGMVDYRVGDYDKKHSLIIDPELIFSTYSGSYQDNWGSTATPGANGELYGGGVTFGLGYPTTSGAYQVNPGSAFVTDITISKFSSNGADLIYATYLGGNNVELAHSLIENSNGELVILGSTGSSDFPVTGNAFQRNFAGGNRTRAPGATYTQGSDIIISVLSSDGSSLEGSTYIGGTGNDGINDTQLQVNYGDEVRGEVIVDDMDNIYVVSCTQSNDFPVVNPVYDRRAGAQDACLFSLNPSCSQLRFSSYFGGSRDDAAYSLKLNGLGQVVFAGGTQSRNLPHTYLNQTSYSGGSADGFYGIYDPSLDTIYASYVGTPDYDQVYFVDLATDSTIYCAGQTRGYMPQSPSVYGSTGLGQFIQQYSPDGDNLILSTGFGRDDEWPDISLTAFMVDDCGRIFVSGWGGFLNGFRSSTLDLEITPDAYQNFTDGEDFYFMVLEKDMAGLLYATYFGNNTDFSNDHVDGGTSRFSDDGIIYQAVCAGCGGSSDFPTTPGVWSNTNNSTNCNLATIKLDFQLSDISVLALSSLDSIDCEIINVRFNNFSTGASSYLWDFGDGSFSTDFSPTHRYDSAGTYQIKLIAFSDNFCIGNDTFPMELVVKPLEEVTVDSIELCDVPEVEIFSSQQGSSITSYEWNNMDRSPSLLVQESGIYAVTATENNCRYIDSIYVQLHNPQSLFSDTLLCGDEELRVELDSLAENVQWSNGETSRSLILQDEGLFWVNYEMGNCEFRDSFRINFVPEPRFELEGDSVLCGNESTTLSVNTPPNWSQSDVFAWSTGERGTSIIIEEPGLYIVESEIFDPCYFNWSDTIEIIQVLLEPGAVDTIICDEFSLELEAREGSNYQWSTGETDQNIEVDTDGQYVVSYSIGDCPTTDSFNVNFGFTPDLFLQGDSLLCDGEEARIELVNNNNAAINEIIWSNGATGNIVSVEEEGVISVVVRAGDLCPVLFEDEIEIRKILSLDKLPDSTSCEAGSVLLSLGPEAQNPSWSTGEITQEIIVTNSGVYTVNYQIETCVFYDTSNIELDLGPSIRIIGDSIYCENENAALELVDDGQGAETNYLWSTGELGRFLQPIESGYYSVIANNRGCLDSTGIFLRYVPFIEIEEQIDTLLCGGESSILIDLSELETFAEIEWADGFSNPVRSIVEEGDYYYYVKTACQDLESQIHVELSPYDVDEIPIYIPNAFTPNEDGTNDVFKAEIADDLDLIDFHMLVFDRWGNKVFEAFDPNLGWDGSFNQHDLMDVAIFVYTVEATVNVCGQNRSIALKGDLNLQK